MTDKRPVVALPTLLGPELMGAACKGRGPLWDENLDPQEPSAVREERHRAAVDVCWLACPIRVECLATRIAEPSLGGGVWGGQLFAGTSSGRTCQCGTLLPATARANQKWCTERCENKYRKRRNKTPAVIVTATCAHIPCSAVFTKKLHTQRFCDPSCQTRYWNANRPRPGRLEQTWTQLGPGYCHRHGCTAPINRHRRAKKSLWCSENCWRVGVKRLARERQEAA